MTPPEPVIVVKPRTFGQFQYPTAPLHRPGGAQAVFHQEWKKAEADEKLHRTVEAFRQFQDGQLPAGPGADALMAAFRSVENHLLHRPVWQNAADNGTVLLASPRIPVGEQNRLRAEHERSMRTVEEIDKAAGKAG